MNLLILSFTFSITDIIYKDLVYSERLNETMIQTFHTCSIAVCFVHGGPKTFSKTCIATFEKMWTQKPVAHKHTELEEALLSHCCQVWFDRLVESSQWACWWEAPLCCLFVSSPAETATVSFPCGSPGFWWRPWGAGWVALITMRSLLALTCSKAAFYTLMPSYFEY